MFDGFRNLDIRVNGVQLRGKLGPNPERPPLLLLHGHPESHLMWHRVAPGLTRDFFVVAPEMRGYGDSGRPDPGADNSGYSKREMARDALALTKHLGHDRFAVAGHDRGARVAARLAADAPESITGTMLMDIAPTLDMYEATDRDFAIAYWHWFFLIQDAPLPERLIAADPRTYIEAVMGNRHAGLSPFPAEVLEHYIAGFSDVQRVSGACGDYRAAATIDLLHDRADRSQGLMIGPELRVLWAKYGVVERLFNPLDLWERVALHVSGRSLDCGHYLPEERPTEVLEEMRRFFGVAQGTEPRGAKEPIDPPTATPYPPGIKESVHGCQPHERDTT